MPQAAHLCKSRPIGPCRVLNLAAAKAEISGNSWPIFTACGIIELQFGIDWKTSEERDDGRDGVETTEEPDAAHGRRT